MYTRLYFRIQPSMTFCGCVTKFDVPIPAITSSAPSKLVRVGANGILSPAPSTSAVCLIMFAIRRLQAQPVRFVSTAATLQAASATTPVPEDASLKKRRPLKTRRPKISLEQPREWKRPLAYGVLPAFDEALKFIKADSEALKVEMQNVQALLTAAKQAPELDPVAIRQMEEKLDYLEIQGEINFPEVQWKCGNGMGT